MRPQGIGLPASALGWVLAARWAATQTANGDASHRLSLQSDTTFHGKGNAFQGIDRKEHGQHKEKDLYVSPFR